MEEVGVVDKFSLVLTVSPPPNTEEEEDEDEEVDEILVFTRLDMPPFTLGFVFKSAFVTKFILLK